MPALIALLALAGEGGCFFERREVDFWGRATAAPVPAPELWPESTAPAPARRLLEAPTRENARAYLAWQEERLRQLGRAAAALAEARRERAGPILYFARPGCRYCEIQDRELQGLPVTRVPPESPLWRERGVRVTPTLVVRGKIFEGLTRREVLLGELGDE
jgi:hypothetical protein